MRNCGSEMRKVKCGMTRIGRSVKPRDRRHSAYYRNEIATGTAVKCRPEMLKMQTVANSEARVWLLTALDPTGPHRTAEVCGLRTRMSADPDPQIFLRTWMVRGSAKQTHLRTRTIHGSKATSIVCRTNLERKCQCTSSQQFENGSIFGHCSRLCKKACLTVWGPRHCLSDTV